MEFVRSAGVLLHPTSLPSPYGIGELGPTAVAFVDFLVESKQSLWQIL
ncbi:MAG: 4-alpha-glucanotransferase, partial [Anaerolineae bacterium]